VTATALERADSLVHDALFYTDASSYRAGLLDFIRAGLADDEPVLVAVPQPGLGLVRSTLTPDEEPLVRTRDMAVAGRNPGRIIGTVLSAFVREHAGRRVRIVGEPIWAGRSTEEYPACAEHEALINVALGDAPAYILCPYDATHLDRSVLVDATRTHPMLASGPHRWASPGYTDPRAVAASFDRPLPPPPAHALVLVIAPTTAPSAARRFVHDYAERARMTEDRTRDLRLVAQELTLNTLVHAGGHGLLSIWAQQGEVVCQVQDGGRIDDPLVGRRAPGPADVGHGLFAVHQVSDLVRVHRRSEGTTVRVHIGTD
jgi:anti-sigma regulatory factor (Ser/Thr protein kinase)